MNDLITISDALKSNVGAYSKGEFLLKLFVTAEELGILKSEVALGNKLAIRLIQYTNRKLKEIGCEEELRHRDYEYISIRNIMYIIELYLKSYEFEKSGWTWYDVVKIIDEDKKGISNLVRKSEEYLSKRMSKVKTNLEIVKRKCLKSPVFHRYLSMIKDIEVANTSYISYITFKEFLYELQVITNTPLFPMFITENVGYKAIEQMLNNILKELDVIELFALEDINNLVLKYMEQTNKSTFNGNLFELVITNYLFSNLTNENPIKLKIDKPDAKIIFEQIVLGRLTAKEVLADGINELNIPKCKANYIAKMEVILDNKIESIKERKTILEEFIVTI